MMCVNIPQRAIVYSRQTLVHHIFIHRHTSSYLYKQNTSIWRNGFNLNKKSMKEGKEIL